MLFVGWRSTERGLPAGVRQEQEIWTFGHRLEIFVQTKMHGSVLVIAINRATSNGEELRGAAEPLLPSQHRFVSEFVVWPCQLAVAPGQALMRSRGPSRNPRTSRNTGSNARRCLP